MTARKLATLLVLLCVTVGVFAQSATTYPVKKGAVNDYAGKLDQAQINELTGLIRHYERETSIEFVIVIVDNLEGMAIRDYATGLGDSWRIGKAGRNNGIVLLWAPNSRSYSFRVASGLSADLNNADANLITQQNLLPNFRRGDYYAGLKETVLAAMEHLGNKPWEERLKAREQARAQAVEQEMLDRKRRAEEAWQAEVQRRQQEARQAEDRAEDARVGLIFLLVAGITVPAGIFIYRSQRRKAKLAEMAEASTAIANDLATAEKNAPELRRLLDDFAQQSPEQDISQLRQSFAGQQDRILKIKVDAQVVDLTKLESYDEMVRVRANAESEALLLDNTKGSIAKIRAAKAQSQALMDQLSRERFEITDVRDSSRTDEVNRLLLQSRHDYEQARQGSSMSVVDWLVINQMLNNSHSQMQQAVQCSQEAPYAPSFSSLDDDSSSSSSRRYSSSSSLFGSSSSPSSSSSSSSFSSSSSSGGGGGFSSGSGSDGSY
ncbi:MAG: TPM domain-containing protein [Acidobacteriia bacterium]|nr:TPM domain-containing protein [Terriglobia bacterium]